MQRKIFKEFNNSVSTDLIAVSANVTSASMIHDGLYGIQQFLDPANATDEPVLPSWQRFFLKLADKSLILGAAILDSLTGYKTIYKFIKDPNKNLEKSIDLGVCILKTAATWALLAAGAVAAPYIIGGICGLMGGYALFNVFKHGYLAFKAYRQKNKDVMKQHLWAIPKQLLSAAINGLGFVANYLLAFGAGKALLNVLSPSVPFFSKFALIQNASELYAKAKPILLAFTALVSFKALLTLKDQAMKMFAVFKGKQKREKTLTEDYLQLADSKPYYVRPIMKLFTVVPLAIDALDVVTQLPGAIAGGLMYVASKIKNWLAPQTKAPAPKEPISRFFSTGEIHAAIESYQRKLSDETKRDEFDKSLKELTTRNVEVKNDPNDQIKKDKQLLQDKITAEKIHLETKLAANKGNRKQLQGKLNFVNKIGTIFADETKASNSYLSAVNQAEKDSFAETPILYRSFFSTEGKVEEISRIAKDISARLSPAPSA